MTEEHTGGGDREPGPGPRGTWDDVAARFSELGTTMRERYAAARSARPTGAPPTGDATAAPPEPETAEERARSDRAVDQLLHRLDDVFTSVGDTLRDPSLRRDASSAFEALAEAVGSSLSELGEEVRRRSRRGRTGDGDDTAPPPPPPPPPSPT